MSFEFEHPDPEAQNAFWEKVRGCDEFGEPTTMWEELEARGWLPVQPESLSDDDLPTHLTRLILDISWMHVYLHCAEHLPDRELYEELVDEVMNNPIGIWPNDPESAISLSFVCERGEEGTQAFYRFYATEEERRTHMKFHPQLEMPPSELPPYPRPWIPIRPIFD